MTYPVTHVTVRDIPPPRPPVITVGHIYPVGPDAHEPEVVFGTVERSIEDAETKVVRKNRRVAAPVNEEVDTK